MSIKFIFNKEKVINDPDFVFLRRIFGDTFKSSSMDWINDCDGKPCYEKDGQLYCIPHGYEYPYHIHKDWCDIIEVEDTEDVKDDGIKITYIGEKRED